MRRAAALFSLLIIATSLCAQNITVTSHEDYKRPYITTPPANTVTAGRFSFRAMPIISRHITAPETCYTMHTLVVAKQPDSDETNIVRERTCTPSSQFQTKNAVRQPK